MTAWQRWRHILIVGLIVLICVAPLWLAHVLVHRDMHDWSKTAKGVLIKPVNVKAELGSLSSRWHIVYVTHKCCDKQCQTHLFHLNQIRRAIHHAWSHSDVVLIRPASCRQSLPSRIQPKIISFSLEQQARWRDVVPDNLQSHLSDRVYLVDPKGFLMMGYANSDPAIAVLQDLKHLLWVTRGDRDD